MKTFTYAAFAMLAAVLPLDAAAAQWPEGAPLTYRFPGGGVRNANRQIGPFCCTGETVTIADIFGEPVGYIYFFDFAGGRNVGPNRSTATSVGILLSYVPPGRAPVVSRVSFDAAGWRPGTTRTLRVGDMTFVVAIHAAIDTSAGDSAFDMQSLRATVRVIGAG